MKADFPYSAQWVGSMMFMGLSSLYALEIPPTHEALAYSDYVHIDLNSERARFDRRIEVEAGLQHDSPGARIRFCTNATSVKAKFNQNGLHQRKDVMNSVGVWLIEGKQAGHFQVGHERSELMTVVLLDQAAMEKRLIELILPYGDSLDFTGLEVNDGAVFFPVEPRPSFRYVAYGDSITQGFQCSMVSRTYPFLVAEAKKWQLVNLGFGWRQATALDGVVVGSFKADIITILMGYNDYITNKPLKSYEADLQGVIRNIRAQQPLVPIYLLTPLWSTEPHPTTLGLKLEDYRKVVRNVAEKAEDQNLHLVEGLNLIPNDPQYFSDGVHPNDAGFSVLAWNLEKIFDFSFNLRFPK
jgi:lysophospholipase L1-like esterase